MIVVVNMIAGVGLVLSFIGALICVCGGFLSRLTDNEGIDVLDHSALRCFQVLLFMLALFLATYDKAKAEMEEERNSQQSLTEELK